MDGPVNDLGFQIDGQTLVDTLTIVLIEAVAAVSENSTQADNRLEDLAGKLLTISSQFNNPRLSAVVRHTAEQLIQTEAGTG